MTALNHKVLNKKELSELIQRYKSGDKNAFDLILQHNERLVYRIAMYYLNSNSCGDVTIDDLMQLGRIGLFQAIERFDPGRNVKFTTYAVYWIRLNIRRMGTKEGSSISMPSHVFIERGKASKARAELFQELDREPTCKEIHEKTGIKPIYISTLQMHTFSIDTPFNDCENDNRELVGENDTENEVFSTLTAEQVRETVETLDQPGKKVLKLHFGFGDEKPKSLLQISRQLNLTIGQVRDIYTRSMFIIRKKLV
jgi:RNA polymerase sigma factor (sigma-70 family)